MSELDAYACSDCMKTMNEEARDERRELEAERKKLPDHEINLLELSGEHLCKSQNVVERSTGELMVHAARVLRLLGPEPRAELGLRVAAGEGRFLGWSWKI